MPSDIEMGDSDSSILDSEITLGPEIVVNIKPAPERVVHRCKEYLRHLISAECERIFSSTKKLTTPERNRLHE